LHQRRLEATVSLLEDGLDRMERLLADGGPVGIVRAVKDTLPASEHEELLAELRELRCALSDFAREFSLQTRPLDIHQILNAELSSAWVMLENCRPRRMKGYGQPFEPETWASLEESVELLLAKLQVLRARLR
jgi:hypothetical protein